MKYVYGDHLSGKPGNVWNFDSCQRNVRDITGSQGSIKENIPLPSTRHGDSLKVNREYYQNCCVLDCVTQCSQSAAHLYEQLLQVQQTGFVTLGPLSHALRRLPGVVLL